MQNVEWIYQRCTKSPLVTPNPNPKLLSISESKTLSEIFFSNPNPNPKVLRDIFKTLRFTIFFNIIHKKNKMPFLERGTGANTINVNVLPFVYNISIKKITLSTYIRHTMLLLTYHYLA